MVKISAVCYIYIYIYICVCVCVCNKDQPEDDPTIGPKHVAGIII
jgi:hypothetical protein